MMHENTVDYILGRLSKQDRLNDKISKFATDTDEALIVVTKSLLKVKNFNKTMTIFSILCVAFGYLGVKKIKELEKEIKELKKMKGD